MENLDTPGASIGMIFTKETLKRSLKPIIFMLAVCAIVWFWGNYRKVSIDLYLKPVIQGTDKPVRMDMTIVDAEDDTDVAASFSQPLASDRMAQQRLDLRPGQYLIRGIITSDKGKTHVVKQYMNVPEDNATIELFLRE